MEPHSKSGMGPHFFLSQWKNGAGGQEGMKGVHLHVLCKNDYGVRHHPGSSHLVNPVEHRSGALVYDINRWSRPALTKKPPLKSTRENKDINLSTDMPQQMDISILHLTIVSLDYFLMQTDCQAIKHLVLEDRLWRLKQVHCYSVCYQ